MVWIIKQPHGFGDYHPEGEALGYNQKLARSFSSLAEDVKAALKYNQLDYNLYVSTKFNGDPSKLFYKKLPCRPVLESEWPDELRILKSSHGLGDVLTGMCGVLVSAKFREIVERLEPGVHQFRPITITLPKGTPYPKPYFKLLIEQHLDSFAPELSVKGSYCLEQYDYYRQLGFDRNRFINLALKVDKFGKAHLWQEAKLRCDQLFFVSDELAAEIRKAKLHTPTLHRLTQVEAGETAQSGHARAV